MCEYISFLVDKQGRLYFGKLDSHDGIEAGHGLRPGDYREAEWTAEEPTALSVRVEEGEDPNYYRAMILAEYPTRSDMIAGQIIGKNGIGTYYYWCGDLHREDGPAIERIDGEKSWYWAGECHREDGPAVEHADGSREWYWAGERQTFAEWKKGRRTL